MKIGIMGGGGIGSYLAALFARGGHEVVLICRGAHFEAIKSNGLWLDHAGKRERIDGIRVTNDAAAESTVDALVVTVKLYDLASAAKSLHGLVGSQTLVVPIQNGVAAHDILNKELGPGRSCGGTVFISAAISEPGTVKARSDGGRLIFGHVDGTTSAQAQAFDDACRQSGLTSVIRGDILASLWEKFIVVSGTAAVSCLSRKPLGYICEDAGLRQLMVRGMQEGALLAKELRIAIDPRVVEDGLAFARSVSPTTRVSMLEDLESGKPLELDWLSGHMVRQAAALGMDAPVHQIAYACLRPYSRV